MEDHRTKLLKGLNFKKDQYLKLLEKYERLQDERRKQRYDTLYTGYGLFSDCLKHPDRTRMEHVEKFIVACKADLKEEDLEELRKIRKMVINDLEVAIKTVFPCARKLDEGNQATHTETNKQFNLAISKEVKKKVKAIETEALSKGWTHDQLWFVPDYPRYDQMGLICFVDDKTSIGEVSEKYIALTHESPTGGPITNNFYNMKVEQPWISKSCENAQNVSKNPNANKIRDVVEKVSFNNYEV